MPRFPPGVQPDQFGEDAPIKRGVPDGLQRRWHKNGQLWEERPYSRGILNGTCRNWDANGHPLAADELQNGTGVLHSFHPDGRLRSECPYILGRKNGVERQWYPGGQLEADTAYEAGVTEGWSRFYFRDGRLSQEGFCRGGKAYGVLRNWDEGDGQYTERTPTYYVESNPVSAEEFARLAKDDRDLRRSLDSLSAQAAPAATGSQ